MTIIINPMPKQLFDKVIELGIKYDNHYSDLYIPVTSETTKLLTDYGIRRDVFKSNKDEDKGSLWYDVAFHYLPYWYNKPGVMVNGYTIHFNTMWNKWIIAHDEIGAGLAEFDNIDLAIEYCKKG